MKRPLGLRIIGSTFAAFMQNDLTTSAAAVSYFAMLALFPTLLLLLAAGNHVLGAEAVEKYVIGDILARFSGAHSVVRRNLESIQNVSSGVLLASAVAVLWAMSWMFTAIEKALNRIWGTYPRTFWRGRAVNFAMMAVVWGLLGGSALFAAFTSTARSMTETLPVSSLPMVRTISDYAWSGLFIIGSVSVTIGLFAMLFKWLPNTRISFLEALPGAVLAGALWEGAKYGFAYLLPFFHYELVYGSIGAAIALLTWVYLSSTIMLLGAQFTALLHRDHLYETRVLRDALRDAG